MVMKMKVEAESKYYCLEPEMLIKEALKNGFKEKCVEVESDEYFTDIESSFIKNRTCLRIRKTNNDSMELTYKGKSNSLLGSFCKLENNICLNIDEYLNALSLFCALGYYSYVEVDKTRITYELKNSEYQYSIMLDKLPGIGGFVEFEIIADSESASKEVIQNKLKEFISLFSDLNLKEATKPYRDIVALSIYDKLTSGKDNKLYINIDSELTKYEKDFFKKYKDQISHICGGNIKWGNYKGDIKVSSNIDNLIREYFDNLIFDGKELLVTFELLKKVSYEKYFVTKVNKEFLAVLFEKLLVDVQNVIYLDGSNERKVNLMINSSINLSNSTLKETNSNLLILINNHKK